MAKRTRATSCVLGGQLRLEEPAAVERILAAFRETGGNVKRAAKLLEVPPRTVHNWIKTSPALAEQLEAIRQDTGWWGRRTKPAA